MNKQVEIESIIIDKKTEGSLIVAFKKKKEGNTKQTC